MKITRVGKKDSFQGIEIDTDEIEIEINGEDYLLTEEMGELHIELIDGRMSVRPTTNSITISNSDK